MRVVFFKMVYEGKGGRRESNKTISLSYTIGEGRGVTDSLGLVGLGLCTSPPLSDDNFLKCFVNNADTDTPK